MWIVIGNRKWDPSDVRMVIWLFLCEGYDMREKQFVGPLVILLTAVFSAGLSDGAILQFDAC